MKAKLIILNHSGGCRVLKEMEGSGNRYYCGPNETSKTVRVKPATIKTLQSELKKLSIVVSDHETIKLVAKKFRSELCSLKGGRLADDQSIFKGLFEIISEEE